MAISCALNRNLLRSTSCGYSLPEVKDIYLCNYSDVTSSDIATESGSCEEITAITIASGANFYHIEPAKDSVEFSDELVVEDNGNKYRTHSLSFNIAGRYDACMHGALDALSLGRYFAVVATAEGTWLALGRLTGLEAETATLAGGGDNNGISVTLSANVTESAIPLSNDAKSYVLGKVHE